MEQTPETPRIPRQLLLGVSLVVAGLGVLLALWLVEPNAEPDVSLPNAKAPAAPAKLNPGPVLAPTPKGAALIGRVVDLAGSPASGVSVAVSRDRGTADPLEAVTETVTDNEGRFRVNGLEEGHHRIRVFGGVVVDAEVRFVSVPGDVEIVAARRVEIRGRVIGGGGSTVHLSGEGAHSGVTVAADANGGFLFKGLSAGDYRLWANGNGQAARAITVSRKGPGPFVDAILVMEPSFELSGRVIRRGTRKGVVAAVEVVSAAEPARTVRSDADGGFAIAGILPGRWTARARAPGFVLSQALTFEATPTYRLELAMNAGGVVLGKVVDSSGTAVEGARVVLHGKTTLGARVRVDESSFSGMAPTAQAFAPRGELGVMSGPVPPLPVTTGARIALPRVLGGASEPVTPLPVEEEMTSTFISDKDGVFRVAGVEPGKYAIEVTHTAYATTLTDEVTVKLGETIRPSVELVVGGAAQGQVVDDRGAPVAGAVVTVTRLGRLENSVVTGADGRFRVERLAGAFVVSVTATGFGSGEKAISVEDEGVEIDFELPRADAELVGEVSDSAGFPVRGAALEVVYKARPGRVPRTATTDTFGRFQVQDLAPGAYRVRVSHKDFPVHEGLYETGQPVEVELAYGGGISGLVTDARQGTRLSARIVPEGPGGKKRPAVTASKKGEFSLVPIAAGVWRLAVFHPGYAPVSVEVEVDTGRRPRDITAFDVSIEMDRGASVSGTVRDVDGAFVSGALVVAGLAKARTDANGEYVLRDVAAGRRVLEATWEDLEGALQLDVAPGDELRNRDVVVE